MQPRTWVEISRAALRRNLEYVRARLAHGTGVCAIVKADAYGHGAVECARTFAAARVPWLAVTSVAEGMRLRAAGIEGRILVLAGFGPLDATTLIEQRLTPAVWDAAEVEWLATALRQRPSPGEFAIHLKIETGMGRLGVTPEQQPELLDALRREPRLKVEAVFSHLASAEAGDDAPNQRQFERMQALAPASGAPTWHLLNSEGALRHPEWGGALVRCGLALYGYSAQAAHAAHLTPALAWKSRVAAVKTLPAGHGIGYGAAFRTTRTTRIAVIAAGYADGYRRSFSPAARVFIRGKSAPVAGNISMDLTTVDVTGIDGVSLGDEVTLLGPGLTAVELAQWAGTIPYEILCGISARVARVYLET